MSIVLIGHYPVRLYLGTTVGDGEDVSLLCDAGRLTGLGRNLTADLVQPSLKLDLCK